MALTLSLMDVVGIVCLSKAKRTLYDNRLWPVEEEDQAVEQRMKMSGLQHMDVSY